MDGYTITDGGQVVNQAGQVAMVYRNANRVLWQSRIVFSPRFNVSLAWVEPADAPALLRFRGGCCGGTQQMYFLASPNQVLVWTTGRAR
jgi:hypothetical protein